MVRYDIAALLSRFDVRVAGETMLTGQLSSLLGERLLLTVLAHYLTTVEEREIEVLDGKPHRDNAAWGDDRSLIPRVRDLDGWLVLDGGQLVAVECKQYTSSSTDYASVPEDGDALAAHARHEWEWLARAFGPEAGWDDLTKVALPLKPPDGMPSRDMTDVRRILAVWTPVSDDGRSCVSHVATTTIRGGELADVKVDVFSASLYLRALLAGGMTHLEAADEDLEKVLAALRTVVEVTGISPAG
jgi:hypothetical protein